MDDLCVHCDFNVADCMGQIATREDKFCDRQKTVVDLCAPQSRV